MADDKEPAQIHVEFFVEAVENLRESRKQGRPIFNDREMVRLRWVGDQKRVLVAPAHDRFKVDPETGRQMTYAEAWPRHFEAFRNNAEMSTEGMTPISVLGGLTASKIAELKSQHITTVEQLAALPDRVIGKLGPGNRAHVERAQAYLDNAKSNAALNRAEEVNVELQAKIEAMEKALAAMQADQAPGAEPGEAPGGDEFDKMSKDELREWLGNRDLPVKSSATRDTMIAAARETLAAEAG